MDELECLAFELEFAQLSRYKRLEPKQRPWFWTPKEKMIARQIKEFRQESRTHREPLSQKLEVAS